MNFPVSRNLSAGSFYAVRRDYYIVQMMQNLQDSEYAEVYVFEKRLKLTKEADWVFKLARSTYVQAGEILPRTVVYVHSCYNSFSAVCA